MLLGSRGIDPSHQNRITKRGNISVNGRVSVDSASILGTHNEMETQIHQLEQEAYGSVLRAFKAQSDAITWEKESLITELRKELRVSDDEHRDLLAKVNADDVIRRIREWRQGGEHPGALLSASHISPTISASRKKQKTSQPLIPGLSSMKSMKYHSIGTVGRAQFSNNGFSGTFVRNESTEAASKLVGRKVWTRWPADNNFYEAVITQYNHSEGLHALVYDMHAENETWEWVDLKEISPEDILWEGDDPEIPYQGNHIGRGGGVKNFMGRGGITLGVGRGRGSVMGHSIKKFLPLQNGNERNVSDDLELLNSDALVKEVERVLVGNNPDLLELERVKKMLKEREQTLVDAIVRLADASDGESDGEQPFTNGHLLAAE